VNAPLAGTETDRLFPFCSSRCRLLDLGKWLKGDYVIPGDPITPSQNAGEERA